MIDEYTYFFFVMLIQSNRMKKISVIGYDNNDTFVSYNTSSIPFRKKKRTNSSSSSFFVPPSFIVFLLYSFFGLMNVQRGINGYGKTERKQRLMNQTSNFRFISSYSWLYFASTLETKRNDYSCATMSE